MFFKDTLANWAKRRSDVTSTAASAQDSASNSDATVGSASVASSSSGQTPENENSEFTVKEALNMLNTIDVLSDVANVHSTLVNKNKTSMSDACTAQLLQDLQDALDAALASAVQQSSARPDIGIANTSTLSTGSQISAVSSFFDFRRMPGSESYECMGRCEGSLDYAFAIGDFKRKLSLLLGDFHDNLKNAASSVGIPVVDSAMEDLLAYLSSGCNSVLCSRIADLPLYASRHPFNCGSQAYVVGQFVVDFPVSVRSYPMGVSRWEFLSGRAGALAASLKTRYDLSAKSPLSGDTDIIEIKVQPGTLGSSTTATLQVIATFQLAVLQMFLS